jgi:hypothetical protein
MNRIVFSPHPGRLAHAAQIRVDYCGLRITE